MEVIIRLEESNIVNALKSVPSVEEYIRTLILNDIEQTDFQRALNKLASIGFVCEDVFRTMGGERMAYMEMDYDQYGKTKTKRVVVTERKNGDISIGRE